MNDAVGRAEFDALKEQVMILDQRIQSIVDSANRAIGEVRQAVANNATSIQALQTAVQMLQTSLNTYVVNTNTRFDQIESKINTLAENIKSGVNISEESLNKIGFAVSQKDTGT